MSDKHSPQRRSFAVEVIAEESRPVFRSPFSIVAAKLRFSLLSGALCQPVEWVSFERGDGAAVLLYDPNEDCVILMRQFRYPVFANMTRAQVTEVDPSKAWVFEVVAGSVTAGEDHLEVACRELLEEAGYQVSGKLEPISTFYVSPGATTEKIVLLFAEVSRSDRVAHGGGVDEGEDIEIVELALDTALAMIDRGEIFDAKTIIALQWLARRLNR